jgi:dihydrofolate reductase
VQKLSAFSMVSVDGYFAAEDGDIGWAHRHMDEEWRAFVEGNAKGGGMLLLGRVTYEMMAGWWPTRQAAQLDPVVAKRMNEMPKVVASRTLKKVPWANTRLLKGDLAEGVRQLKQEEGKGITILGSGSLIGQLTRAGLIDEYQLAVMPVALGKGRTVFAGLERPVELRRTQVRQFGNGNLVLQYERG